MRVFGGILAKDKLPKYDPTTKMAYIVNTDKSGEKGRHWILLYCLPGSNASGKGGGGGGSGRTLIYMDPLGKPPHFYNSHLTEFCSKFKKIIKLKSAVQSRQSSLCGLYVLYFLYYLARGNELHAISRNFFRSNLLRNDKIVLRFCWQIFRHCPPIIKRQLLTLVYKHKSAVK